MSEDNNQGEAIHALLRGEEISAEWMNHLSKVTEIDLSCSHYTDLSPLAACTALQTLGLNRWTGTDLSPLAGLTTRVYR